jgi:hypothetical protein
VFAKINKGGSMARRKKTEPQVEQPPVGALQEPTPEPVTEPPKVEEPPPQEPDLSHAELHNRRMHGEPKEGVTRSQAQPNPFSEITVSLTNMNEGPKMRLSRERAHWGHMAAIQFDEKPDDAIRQKLKGGGFAWNQNDGVWKKSLGEHPGVEHRKAQELFEEIANALRKRNGLDPVVSLTGRE